MQKYKIAHICTEGHCDSSYQDGDVPSDASFCTICGSKIIAYCPSCNAAIRGILDSDIFNLTAPYTIPSYCHHCGAAYPWIQLRIDAIAEAAADDENISSAETQKLLAFLPALTADTARTKLGAVFFKRIIKQAGEDLKEVMLDFAAKCTVEAAKSFILK